MLVTVKYFGMIEEHTHTHQENIHISSESLTVEEFQNIILTKYPTLQELTYNIALNQKITTKEKSINNGDELAFLPPFAGG